MGKTPREFHCLFGASQLCRLAPKRPRNANVNGAPSRATLRLRRRFALGYHSSRFQRSNAREKTFCGRTVKMTAEMAVSKSDRLRGGVTGYPLLITIVPQAALSKACETTPPATCETMDSMDTMDDGTRSPAVHAVCHHLDSACFPTVLRACSPQSLLHKMPRHFCASLQVCAGGRLQDMLLGLQPK